MKISSRRVYHNAVNFAVDGSSVNMNHIRLLYNYNMTIGAVLHMHEGMYCPVERRAAGHDSNVLYKACSFSWACFDLFVA